MMESLQVNELFDGRYRLLEKKGEGSYGEVWRACDEHINSEIALKVYSAIDEKLNEEFKAEYKMTCRLNHPNLLRTYYFGCYNDRSYMVMPYCPSSSTTLVGCCNEETFWRFVCDVASGLNYLHKHDIIHHDLKPDNILIGEDGVFLIADFGISQDIRSSLCRNALGKGNDDSLQPSSGTVAYMGPELFLDHPYSVKATDIWALGATLYEMLTGSLPFFGQGGGMLNSGVKLLDASFEFVSKDASDLICDCLNKEPWDRPSAAEIEKYARAKVEGEMRYGSWADYRNPHQSDIRNEEPPVLVKTLEPDKRSGRWIVAASIAAAVVAVALWFSIGNREEVPEQLVVIPEDTVTANEPPALTASYLEVNGSSSPKIVQDHHGGDTLLTVSTDGSPFVISNPEQMPKWMTLNAMTDTSFVLHLTPNNSEKQRKKVLEVTSGDKVVKVSVVQKADAEKIKESKLVEDKTMLNLVEDKNIQ